MSFRQTGFMDELEKSLRYVPTYQIINQIRKEEKAIAKQKVETAKEATKIEKERREKLELAMITTLLDKEVSIEDIAKIMEMTPTKIKNILKKK